MGALDVRFNAALWESGPSGYSEYHHIQIGSGPAKLYQAKMIERYVLLNAADQGIAQDYPAYREKNREKLEQYLSEFLKCRLYRSREQIFGFQ